MKKWVSVIREDGAEVRFGTTGIYYVRFKPNSIWIRLVDIGFSGSYWFGLPTSRVKNAKDGDFWDMQIVTREELEKLRVELQAISIN